LKEPATMHNFLHISNHLHLCKIVLDERYETSNGHGRQMH
jgi:hypothetical protein